MDTHYSHAVRSEHAERSPRELLASSVTVLIGVDDEAKGALESIGVETVHDLATSSVFEVARAVYETASSGDPSGGVERTTAMAAAGREADGDVAALAAADIVELQGLDEASADALGSALGVRSVRDLARWPPYLGARAVLGALTGLDAETERGVPEELVPVARKYATEESFYTKVYLDQRVEELEAPDTGFDPLGREDLFEDIAEHGLDIDWSPQWERIAETLEEIETGVGSIESIESEGESESEGEGMDERLSALSTMPRARAENLLSTAGDRRIDLVAADPEVGGFRQPAVGGVIQFGQEWVPQGLSLGQLLHSTTLAPGESTRMAVIDWSRRTRGEREETETQRERTEASMVQNRSMQEVQNGVAAEVQHGRSMVSSTSTTREKGGGFQAGLNVGPISVGGSTSGGRTTTRSTTETVSTSRGRRAVHAEMTQRIRNSTQQQASASRSRRATVIRETEQEESEEVRTRVVTNHNHMHALSVHYYEVVQIFRVEVGPEDAQPVLFVPFKPIDFSENVDIVYRYRDAMMDAALSPQVRDLIAGVTGYVWLEPNHNLDVLIDGQPGVGEMDGEWSPEAMERWRLPTDARITGVRTGQSVRGLGLDFVIERSGGKSDVTVQFPDSAGTLTEAFSVEVDPPVPVGEVGAVDVDLTWADDDPEHESHLQPGIELEGPNGATATLMLSGEAPAGAQRMRVFEGRQRGAKGELAARLDRNRLHYSQAIWESLDPQTVAMLLGGFQVDGRAAIEYVDPRPEATHGNYVAFPLALPESVEEAPDETYAKLTAWWDRWTQRNFDDKYRERDLVPLASGGVHGESILGRANGAEKLDITRFWDWQESPIPQQSPQIAPVGTGSRATDEDLTPSDFERPIIQMQQPQSLPDPTGVGAVLDTLGSSGLFRDMSGLEAAAELAGTTGEISGRGARHAADTAARTFEAASQARVQQTETLAELAAALAGGGEFSAQNAGNSSFGAALNELKRMDGSPGRSGSSASAGGRTGDDASATSDGGSTDSPDRGDDTGGPSRTARDAIAGTGDGSARDALERRMGTGGSNRNRRPRLASTGAGASGRSGGPDEVCFMSGECLPTVVPSRREVVEGPGGSLRPRYWDPLQSGNPLLDTSGEHRNKQLSPNFSVDEFAQSGGERFDRARIDPDFVVFLEQLRAAANARSEDDVDAGIAVASGYRSYEYNIDEIDGADFSPHCAGYGADVKFLGDLTPLEFAKVALRQRPCDLRIGYVMDDGYVHFDLKPRDNPQNPWTFDSDPGMWDYEGTPADEFQELVDLRTGTADREGFEERFGCWRPE
jgi:hypothetical protein